MKSLSQAVDDYIALRRGLGFKLRKYGICLHEFVSFMEGKGAQRITSKLAVEYATQRRHEKPWSHTMRLYIIRGFARYRSNDDPATEVPALKLLPFKSRRARPYLYSQDEIQRLLQAARNIVIRSEFLPHMYPCFFGLLAVTGMRLGEAINLQPQDVDWRQGVLTIRNAKFGRTRLVPLRRSTLRALRQYAEVRDRMHRGRSLPYFFVSSRGVRLQEHTVSEVFRKLCRQIGIRQVGAHQGPRLHDLRHRFAVETLLRWYRRRPEEITKKLPVLSTYLGHVSIVGTYWYLSNTPELMTAASELLEARWKGVAQ